MPLIKPPLNILLVDDHPENLLALEAVLETPEYHLVRAHSGMEALRLLLQGDYSAILLDVQMPGLNGYETAALIRERPKTRNIPIIFITAVNKSKEDIAKGYSAGAVDYIIKPFNPETLKAKVEVLAGLHHRDRELEAVKQPEPSLDHPEESPFHPERYRTLANAIPQIVWIAQPDGAADFFNEPWFTYSGLTFEQSEGLGWKKVFHPEDLQPALQSWKETLHTKKEYRVEGRLKRADGVYRWHLVRALPERDPQGRILAWLGTAVDINDQKQGEARLHQIIEALEEKKREAEAATRLKSEFISHVAHELRTMLNSIIGYSALQAEGVFGRISERQKIPVEGIQRNASGLLDLVNNLLDLSRLESRQMALFIESVDLRTLLLDALENLQLIIDEKKLEIKWRIQNDVKKIHSDSSRIRQIFMNLISNAIKFTEQGSITLSVANAEGGIVLSIQDTGIGIKQEDLPIIFEAFRQIDSPLARKSGGSGLGLTIVKNLLEVLHGRIEVQSEYGRGSTFTIFLPESFPKEN
jgi:PAS domain S-box-containing protein